MEEPKTLSYDWQYGREELFLRVDSYMSDDNLYIGLYHMEDGYPESFADLTVNLPFAPLGGINEAYIDHNFSKEKLRFIKQHKLGTIQPEDLPGWAKHGLTTIQQEQTQKKTTKERER